MEDILIFGSPSFGPRGPGSKEYRLEALKAEGLEPIATGAAIVFIDRVNIDKREVIVVGDPEGSYFLFYNINDTEDPDKSNWALAIPFEEKMLRHF